MANNKLILFFKSVVFEFSTIKVINLLLLLFFFMYLEYNYANFIHINFGRDRYIFDFDVLRYLVSKLIFVALLLVIHHKRISDFVYAILYLIVILMLVPNLILYQFMDIDFRIIALLSILVLMVAFVGTVNISFSGFKLVEKQKTVLLFSIIVLMLIPFIITYGFDLDPSVLLFKNIYKVRAESALKATVYTGYLYGWLGKVALPIMLIYSIGKRNKLSIAFTIICLIYLFLIAAHKTMFFTILVVCVFYISNSFTKKITYLLFTLVLAFFIGRFFTVVSGSLFFESIIVRRVLFVPALLNEYYFDFFDDNFLYLSHSIFKGFIQYPYQLDPSHLIASEYFGKPEMSSNNGIISDGFMNFGFFGVLGFITLFSIIIGYFNSMKLSPRFFGVFFLLMLSINSGALLTNFLTHGLLLLMILSFFVLRNTNFK